MRLLFVLMMFASSVVFGNEVKSSYPGVVKAVTCNVIQEESSVGGAIVGGGVGTVGGSMVGSMLGGRNGSVVGGLLGGLAGGAAGNSMGGNITYQCDMLVTNSTNDTELFFSTITTRPIYVDRKVTVLVLSDGTYKVL